MSSGRECELIEATPNEWFYILQSAFCPVDHWDWREHDPIVGGPFATVEECTDGLLRDNSNPGGWMVQALQPGQTRAAVDDTLQEILEKARRKASRAPAWTPRLRSY